jgi:hypothetical protein
LASTSAALLAIGNFAARLTACEKTWAHTLHPIKQEIITTMLQHKLAYVRTRMHTNPLLAKSGYYYSLRKECENV